MGFLDKIGGAGKAVSDKSKSVSDAGNIKNKIAYEEERIVEVLTDIGKEYYKSCYKKSSGDVSHLNSLCEDIDARKKRIVKMKLELSQLKGYKICTKCGAKQTSDNMFCGKCGSKLPDVTDENFSSLDLEGFYNDAE